MSSSYEPPTGEAQSVAYAAERIQQMLTVKLRHFERGVLSFQDASALATAWTREIITTTTGKPMAFTWEPGYVGDTEESQWGEPFMLKPASQAEGTADSPVARLLQGVMQKVASKLPWRISTRDLSRHTTKFLGQLQDEQRAGLITYRGIPSFLVVPIDQSDVFTHLMGNSPKLRERHQAALEEVDQGKGKLFPSQVKRS